MYVTDLKRNDDKAQNSQPKEQVRRTEQTVGRICLAHPVRLRDSESGSGKAG